MAYPIAKILLPFIFKLWIKEVRGIEKIPKDGPFIVCPNHSSYMDDLIVPVIIVPVVDRVLHMYVNRRYFGNFFLRKFLEWGGSIPVEVYDAPDKKEVNEGAFEKALEYLRRGDPVGIYPEGHRSGDGEIQKAKTGAVRLALSAGVPVLPVGIVGTWELFPKGKIIPKVKKIIRVNIGKPIYFTEKKEPGEEDLNNQTRRVMREIGKLIGKEYRH